MKSLVPILLSILLFGSCQPDNKNVRENQIYRIVFSSGGCFGTCPIEAFSIDSSLKLNYCGYEFTSDSGCFQGMISDSLWNEINFRFEKMNYKVLDSIWCENTVDAPSSELLIYYSGGVKRIKTYNQMCFPDSVSNFYDWLIEIPHKSQLIPIPAIDFEIRTGGCPPPTIDSFQFTEPKLP